MPLRVSLCDGRRADLPHSHLHSQHFFQALKVGEKTRPTPQLQPGLMRHLHNLPAQRLTPKAVDAWPARFTLDLERFAALLATSLQQHAAKVPILLRMGVPPRGETILGGQVSGLRTTKNHDQLLWALLFGGVKSRPPQT
jgi:hypothetical protein